MSELWRELPYYTLAHLQLSLAALALAALASVPLGVAVSRRPRLAQLAIGTSGVVQTVPSLALLALMVPLFAWLGGWSESRFGVEIAAIGRGPALVTLTLYGMLPILQNTAAGLRSVDPALREAADALGMTPGQRLRRVEIPLALPVLVAGLRTAAIWIVGTATLATPVGAPSLGHFIFSGLQTRNYAAVTLGCVASATLAIAVDQSIRALEHGARARTPRRALAGALALGLLAAAAGGAWLVERRDEGRGAELVVGAKTFSEQFVLAEILSRFLEREAGLRTRTLGSLGSTVLFDALRAGEIDLYVDYSGTLWATVLGQSGDLPPRDVLLAEVHRMLAEEHGIEVAAALGFENAYAFAMRADRARELGVGTLGELARHAPALTLGSDYEFLARPEWRAVERRYGLAFRAARSMDPSLMYQALASGDVDVISAFSTDGRIAAFDLVLLEDERAAIPPYDALVLTGPRLADRHPGILELLAQLDGAIDAASMQRLNAAVDLRGETPAAVARAWLAEFESARSKR